jgi:uncharacterized membrane protein YoaK (UPF0700 family)
LENKISLSARTLGAIGFPPDDRHGPLPLLLLVLTAVTGLLDAVSYLALGHVFVGNMTGNVLFLGFAVAGVAEFSVLGSLVALAAFLAGAFAGGRLGTRASQHRGHVLARATYLMTVLVGVAFVVSMLTPQFAGERARYVLIVMLALAMGLQNATARRLGVPDLVTNVLTSTLTGLAADSTLPDGRNPSLRRRLAATLIMFVGAAAGAFLIFHHGVNAALALALALLVVNGMAAYRLSSGSEAWTVGM